MAAALLLSSSRTTLVHASLATVTPEVSTLDSVIHGPSPTPLPTELLWLIRSHLLPLVTAHLIAQSENILAGHERRLLSLLCNDCAAYNLDIYGNSVFRWPWDQFSGPCACRGDSGDYTARIDRFNRCVNSLRSSTWVASPSDRHEDRDNVIDTDSLQFGPRYLNANHILEFHLSREARKFVRWAYKDEVSFSRSLFRQKSSSFNHLPSPEFNPKAACLRTRSFLRAKTIWDVVDIVLREQYGCEAFEHGASTTPGITGDDHTCSTGLSHQNDTIMELHRSFSFSHLESTNGTLPPINKQEPEPSSPSTHQSPPSDSTDPRRLSAFWSLSSPQTKRDRVYISPLQHDDIIIQAHGFRNTPRSWTEYDNLTLSSPSLASSEDKTPIQPGRKIEGALDPWVSRAQLIYTKTDLGLDLDYSHYCATLKARSTTSVAESIGGSVRVDKSGSQTQWQQGSGFVVAGPSNVAGDMEVGGEDLARHSNPAPFTATEAMLTTPFPIPPSMLSALSTAHTLIRSRSSCYRPYPPIRRNIGSGCFQIANVAADPHQQHHQQTLYASDSTSQSFSLNDAMTPSRRLNNVLQFLLTSASILGYSMYLTGFLVTMCISIPLTVARVALTVVCFYSRPSSFRLL